MNKRLWIVFAVLVLATLGGLIFWKKTESSQSAVDTSSLDGSVLLTTEMVGDNQIPDHYQGNKDSKVIVIAYEDFACSHCNSFSDTAKEIYEDYADDVLFIYRNFSLSYPNSTISQSAAEAAYLVGGVDAYWSMHYSLFSDTVWTSTAVSAQDRKTLLTEYANEAGINVDDFFSAIDDYANNGIQAKMNRDKSLGNSAGVTGTPTWYVNGEVINAITETNVRNAIDAELNKSN